MEFIIVVSIRFVLPILVTEFYNIVLDLVKDYWAWRIRIPRYMYVLLLIHPKLPSLYICALMFLMLVSGMEDTGI